MLDDRPQADRILVAQLTGEARHRARWRELSGDEAAAAVAGLRELAGGRADLLAEVAGGSSRGRPKGNRTNRWRARSPGCAARPERTRRRFRCGWPRDDAEGPPRSGPRRPEECTAGEEY